jgi:hypothetical protein
MSTPPQVLEIEARDLQLDRSDERAVRGLVSATLRRPHRAIDQNVASSTGSNQRLGDPLHLHPVQFEKPLPIPVSGVPEMVP